MLRIIVFNTEAANHGVFLKATKHTVMLGSNNQTTLITRENALHSCDMLAILQALRVKCAVLLHMTTSKVHECVHTVQVHSCIHASSKAAVYM